MQKSGAGEKLCARAGVFFLYRDEFEAVVFEDVRLARFVFVVAVRRVGRFEGVTVDGFDESTQIHRMLINGRRVRVEALDPLGTVLAPRGEQWRVGEGTAIEVLMRGHFDRVTLVVEYDPWPAPAAPVQSSGGVQ